MEQGPEQLNIDYGKGTKMYPEIQEKDECQYCGNAFESPGSCRVCASNKQKRDFLASSKDKKDTR